MNRYFISHSAQTIILTLLLFISHSITAQPLIGLVLDADTREPLIGAAVLISGTTTGTTTDFDGLFSLPVQSSDTLVISYMGYQTARLTPKTQQDTLKVLLTTNSEVLQEVAVVSKRRQNSEMSVLQSTKTALSVQTGISSEQIQRTQDRDASEVIRRVPGISLIDDKFVMVRGLSQRYNQVWINGAAVPSSEADSRAFSFDLLPSSQLDNLVIIKSPAPEYPADYSGGMVLVQTRDVPEYRAWQINLGGAMNDQTHCRSFLRTKSSPTDWLGFDSGLRSLSQGIHTPLKGYPNIDNSVSLTDNRLNNDWTTKRITPVSDLSLGFNGSESWNIGNGQSLSMLLSGNYSRSYKHYRDMLNCLFGAYDEAQQRSEYLRQSTDNQQTIHTRLGLMFNLSYARRAGKDRIEFKNIFNQLGRERYTSRVGISAQNDEEQQAEYNYQSRTTYSTQLTGTHLFKDDDIRFRWNAGYAYSNRNQPDRRRYLINDALEAGVLQLSSSNDISREYTYLYEHIASLAFDYAQTFHAGWFHPQLRVGIYGEYRTRDYAARTFYYNWNQAANTLPADFRRLDIPTQLMVEDNYSADRLYLLEQVKWRNNYSGNNTLLAAYAALNMPFGPVNVYLDFAAVALGVELVAEVGVLHVAGSEVDIALHVGGEVEIVVNRRGHFAELGAIDGHTIGRAELVQVGDTPGDVGRGESIGSAVAGGAGRILAVAAIVTKTPTAPTPTAWNSTSARTWRSWACAGSNSPSTVHSYAAVSSFPRVPARRHDPCRDSRLTSSTRGYSTPTSALAGVAPSSTTASENALSV